jgi:hypothetical protein
MRRINNVASALMSKISATAPPLPSAVVVALVISDQNKVFAIRPD